MKKKYSEKWRILIFGYTGLNFQMYTVKWSRLELFWFKIFKISFNMSVYYIIGLLFQINLCWLSFYDFQGERSS